MTLPLPLCRISECREIGSRYVERALFCPRHAEIAQGMVSIAMSLIIDSIGNAETSILTAVATEGGNTPARAMEELHRERDE